MIHLITHTHVNVYIYIYIHICVYLYICIYTRYTCMYMHDMAVESRFFHLQINGQSSGINQLLSRIFRNSTCFFRGVMVIHLVLLRRSQTACAWTIWETAMGKCKAMFWFFFIIPPGKNRASVFQDFLDAAQVLHGLWASMGTNSFSTARSVCETKIARKTPPVNPPPWIVGV